ncbi:hypothetical protein K7432_007448 [Basidiobolus ranarum]|uniref:Uncharacterized protein n=1 Tax=Basidiobolus ranarum TaxID=34480 RepID=A0ABR2WTD0_9FUNG
MEVQTLNASISEPSFKTISHHDCRLHNILPVNTEIASNYKHRYRPSIESMEDLFDGATQTHTQETVPSQVPKSLEQKLLDGAVESSNNSNSDPIQEAALKIVAALEFDEKKRTEQHKSTETSIIPEETNTILQPSSDGTNIDGPTEVSTSSASAPVQVTPCSSIPKTVTNPLRVTSSASSSFRSLQSTHTSIPSGYQSDVSDISASSQESPLTPYHEKQLVPHIIIDKTSIPGINLAPSAFVNNSYLTDTDDEASSQKSKDPMYPSSPGSSLLSPQTRSDRRRSQPASDSPRMVEISGSKYILYGRSKSRSLYDSQEASRSGNGRTRRMSAIGEIVGGSMKYGIGKLLRKKRWQEEGKQSKEDGKWKYTLSKLA